MTIRQACSADVDWLAETLAGIYRSVFQPMLPEHDLRGFDSPFFQERFGREWPKVRIVTRAAQCLGFTMMTGSHVDMVFVTSEARGSGVGAELLADVVAQGARSLESFAANASARSFYEKRGWMLERESSRMFAGRDCAFVRYILPVR